MLGKTTPDHICTAKSEIWLSNQVTELSQPEVDVMGQVEQHIRNQSGKFLFLT